MKRLHEGQDSSEVEQAASAPAPTSAGLTLREREVLQRVALGQTNAQVAAGLRITPGTVRNHLSAVYAKLRVRSKAEAVSWAWRSGLVRPGP